MDIQKLENSCISVFLTSHNDYLKILSTIRKDTAKIVIVQIDGYDKNDPVIKNAEAMMTLEKKENTNRWFGTKTTGNRAVKYTFIKNRDFFTYLESFESFFIGKNKFRKGYVVIDTDFGIDDIAFLDAEGKLLFYTTTHEGMANINRKYKDILPNLTFLDY